jgi:chemotaxis-related protein WspD
LEKVRCRQRSGVSFNNDCDKLAIFGNCHDCPDYIQSGRDILNRPIPDGLTDEWTKAVALPKEIIAEGTVSVVIFGLATEWFALKTELFLEVLEASTVHYVPFRSNSFFKGLVNVNGELLLSIDLAKIIGISNQDRIDVNTEKSKRRNVVVLLNNERFAFEVDNFMGVYRILPDNLQKSPATVSKSPTALTCGIFLHTDVPVGMIDEDKFFGAIKERLVW